MRISVFLFSLLCLLILPGRAQDPGAQQDAEAAREKILKAADQIDLIESNSEATKSALDGMKADIARLQDENTTLKQQVAALQAALDAAQAAHTREQQVLIDEVAKLIASGKGPGSKKKNNISSSGASTPAQPKLTEPQASATASGLTPPADTASTASGTSDAGGATVSSGDTPTPPLKPSKGYYHVVENGETLTMICSAYRQQGINVTVSQIRKANGLTDSSMLKVGQKLFIPKPGT